jgi:hypothetical protein
MHQRSAGAAYVGVPSAEMDRTSVGKPREGPTGALKSYLWECCQPIIALSVLLGMLYVALFADLAVKLVMFCLAMVGISFMNRYMEINDVLAARSITARNSTGLRAV